MKSGSGSRTLSAAISGTGAGGGGGGGGGGYVHSVRNQVRSKIPRNDTLEEEGRPPVQVHIRVRVRVHVAAVVAESRRGVEGEEPEE